MTVFNLWFHYLAPLGFIITLSEGNDKTFLEESPEEVIVRYVCKHLKLEGIFNIGECSQIMKMIPLDNGCRPLSAT